MNWREHLLWKSRLLKYSPVAKYLKTIVNFSAGGIAFLIIVPFFFLFYDRLKIKVFRIYFHPSADNLLTKIHLLPVILFGGNCSYLVLHSFLFYIALIISNDLCAFLVVSWQQQRTKILQEQLFVRQLFLLVNSQNTFY